MTRVLKKKRNSLPLPSSGRGLLFFFFFFTGRRGGISLENKISERGAVLDDDGASEVQDLAGPGFPGADGERQEPMQPRTGVPARPAMARPRVFGGR